MKNKTYFTVGMLLFATVLLTSGVCAFAVSTPYWPENPLKISPGQSVDLQIVLKNNAGAEALTVSAEVTQGADVTAITDSSKTYNVPAGGEATMNVRVSVPSDSQIGGNYPVEFTFKTIQSGATGGSVGIGSSVSTRLPVYVVNEEESMVPSAKSNVMLYLVVVVAVLAIVVISLALNKRKSKGRK